MRRRPQRVFVMRVRAEGLVRAGMVWAERTDPVGALRVVRVDAARAGPVVVLMMFFYFLLAERGGREALLGGWRVCLGDERGVVERFQCSINLRLGGDIAAFYKDLADFGKQCRLRLAGDGVNV